MKNTFKFLFIALLSIIPLFIFADTRDDDDSQQKAYQLQIDNWKNVIAIKQKEIGHFKELSTVMSQNMDKELKRLSKAKEATDLKIDQLRFDLVSESRSPFSYRQVLREIIQVAYDYQSMLNADTKNLENLSYYLQLLEEALRSLSDVKNTRNIPQDVVPTIGQMISDLTEIQVRLTYYRDALKKAISSMDIYDGISFSNPTKFNEVVFRQLKLLYLTPGLDLFEPESWMFTSYFREDWVSILKLKLSQNLPSTKEEFYTLGKCILIALIAFLILNFILSKYSRLSMRALKPFKKSLFWFIMSMIFVFYNLSVESPKNSIILTFGVLFFARAVMFLGWGLRVKAFEDIDVKAAPFSPLFWLYFYGAILEFTDQYFPIISTLWIIGLVVFFAWTRFNMKRNTLKFERGLQGLSLFFGLVCVAITLFGMVYLSMISMMGWFLVCVGIQLARYIKYSFHDIVQYVEGSYVFAKIIVIGLSIPILWLLIMMCVFIWGIGQVFGSYFFVSFIDMTFKIHNYSLNLGNLVFIVYLFFVFKTTSHVMRVTIMRLADTKKIESGVSSSISVLAKYALWSLYLVLMLKLIGVDMTSLTVISGGLSVGIGFGMRDILNNFVSGIIILGSHSIKHGDIIEVNGITGKVVQITIRSTVVKTHDNAIVCIPNSTIISDKLINWTNQDLIVRKDIAIGVAYGTDIKKVREIVLKIAKEAEYVLNDPAPSIFVDSFGDSSINLLLRVWVSDISYSLVVMSRIRERIYDEFKVNAIEIPFPQMDVHMIPPNQSPLTVGIKS